MRLAIAFVLLTSAAAAQAEDVLFETVGLVSFGINNKLLVEGRTGSQAVEVNYALSGNLANTSSIELKRSCEAAAKAVMIRPERWDLKVTVLNSSQSITACSLMLQN